MSIAPEVTFFGPTPLYLGQVAAFVSAGAAFMVGAALFAIRLRGTTALVPHAVFTIFFGVVCAVVAALFSLIWLVGMNIRPTGSSIAFVLFAAFQFTLIWFGTSFLKRKVANG